MRKLNRVRCAPECCINCDYLLNYVAEKFAICLRLNLLSYLRRLSPFLLICLVSLQFSLSACLAIISLCLGRRKTNAATPLLQLHSSRTRLLFSPTQVMHSEFLSPQKVCTTFFLTSRRRLSCLQASAVGVGVHCY